MPAHISLDRLHDVIQIVMGWDEKHLHRFHIQRKSYIEEPEYGSDDLCEDEFVLNKLIKRKGQSIEYVYDYGDNWFHIVLVEDTRWELPPHSLPILCVAGSRACPPEDVGGEPGYMEFLAALADPKHEEHENYKEWVGGSFDPETFDINSVNAELAKYWRWSRDREYEWGFL